MKIDAPASPTSSERSPLPLVAAGGATIQATETVMLHEQFVAMNEALMLGAVRQHELTEAAENLIVQLQAEIASHKKTAIELAEKARLLDLTTDAIFVRDGEGRILFWNHGAEALYGWSRADALGKVSHVLLRTEFTTPLEQIEAELHQHNRWTGELVHTKCNGRRITVLVRETQELDAQGKPSLMLENITDITERKQAAADNEKLEVQNRQLQKSESLGRMAGAIAHHFNNQLQAVMLSLQLAMSDLPGNQRPVEGLIKAMQSARKAAEVSTLMLTYLGQAQVKSAPLDLTEVCRQSLALLRSALPPGVFLETDLPTSGPVISANANQLQQILTNLINNAREACSEGRGSIRLSVKTVAAADIPAEGRFPINWQPQAGVTAYACMEVADAGCGIAAKDFDKLFDPFFSTKFISRGLGLPVVLGIARSHDGVVTVESESSRGSTFRVFFPVFTKALPQKPVRVPVSPITKNVRRGTTVLIVEDEPTVRTTLALVLNHSGLSVLEAEDGVAAVEIFRQHRDEIGCVVSDLNMPRMNGWETLTALRQLMPGIGVILVSGYSEAEVMDGDHPERPTAFLQKPYQSKVLINAINQILSHSHA